MLLEILQNIARIYEFAKTECSRKIIDFIERVGLYTLPDDEWADYCHTISIGYPFPDGYELSVWGETEADGSRYLLVHVFDNCSHEIVKCRVDKLQSSEVKTAIIKAMDEALSGILGDFTMAPEKSAGKYPIDAKMLYDHVRSLYRTAEEVPGAIVDENLILRTIENQPLLGVGNTSWFHKLEEDAK